MRANGTCSVYYIGFENIGGHTGSLLPYQPTLGAEIKSTKNIFHPGDILFGKLRPYLNKMHLASTDGICSTDIYVLRPKQTRYVHPSRRIICVPQKSYRWLRMRWRGQICLVSVRTHC